MVAGKPYSGQRKLVLAFDVGTTNSGVSYCILQPRQIPEVRGITRFPGQKEGSRNAKIPSILYYDDSGNVKAAGSEALEIDVIETAMDAKWTKAEWWKLHLFPKHLLSGHIKEDDVPPLPCGKSVVDVLSDFVKYLFQCAKTYIEEHHMGFNWSSIEHSVEFVLTHPNGLDGAQKQQYRRAIERASLVPSTPEGQSRVHLITEGEASLYYWVSNLCEQPVKIKPQGIVIIDGGGGTIDLSTYSMTSQPISCNEIATAECRIQHPASISRHVADLLKRKLQGSSHCSAEELDALTCEFDLNTKPTITSADKPVYLQIGNLRYNNPQYNIKRGALRLSCEEITSLFDEPFNAIIDAFEQQRRSAKIEISMGFLVGGLGTNGLLWSRLQSHFDGQGIKLSRPDNDIIKAVANGALLSNIDSERHLVRTRVARATYGIPHYVFVDEDNPDHVRRKNKWERHSSGKYRIPGAFDSILRKGDQIDEQREIRHPFSASRCDQTNFAGHQVRIMCYHGALPNPRWLDEDSSCFSELCTIRADLRKAAKCSAALKAQSGETYYQVHYNVIASFGNNELAAQITWWADRIEERAPATMVYYNN